jgi:hypothetical protein
LIELFLPVYDQLGNAFAHKHYTAVRKKLEEKFVHVTSYSRVPATVMSDHGKENLPAQAFIVYEIMAADLDSTFWSKYKTTLVKTFGQDDVMIRCTAISVI